MVAKRLFIILLALNALLVLVVVMKKESSPVGGDGLAFKSVGAQLEVVSSLPVESSVMKNTGCVEIGSIPTVEIARQVSQRLISRNIPNEIYEKEVIVSVDYWVIIPPKPSEKQALRLLRQLQLANIDSYIVTQGEYANAISLGLFTVKASAYRVRDKMVESGFNTIVQEIQRPQKMFWLSVKGDLGVIKPLLSGFDVEISDKACKSR